jgi:hypothetical protein
VSRRGLPSVFCLLPFLLLFLPLAHPEQVGPQLPLGCTPGRLALGLLHLLVVVVLLLFEIVELSLVLDGEQADLIFFVHLFRDYLEVVL